MKVEDIEKMCEDLDNYSDMGCLNSDYLRTLTLLLSNFYHYMEKEFKDSVIKEAKKELDNLKNNYEIIEQKIPVSYVRNEFMVVRKKKG